ncbi:MAG: helix-turn-helix transcriptional regulator, partial [Geobacteraceae bacterium]
MECGELLKLLGERIRTLRKGQEISQERLAELAGLHPVFISKIETGM